MQELNISTLPSTRYSTYIKLYAGSMQGNKLTQIDLTRLYNWYVKELGSKLNSVHKQYNPLLFKYIVEWWISMVAIEKWLVWFEGMTEQPIRVRNDDFINCVSSFILNNGIPVNIDNTVESFLEELVYSGFLTYLDSMLDAEFYNHNLLLDTESKITGVDYINVPIQWQVTITDLLVGVEKTDLERHAIQYPYGLDVKLNILGMPIDNYMKLGIGVAERYLDLATDPSKDLDLGVYDG